MPLIERAAVLERLCAVEKGRESAYVCKVQTAILGRGGLLGEEDVEIGPLLGDAMKDPIALAR